MEKQHIPVVSSDGVRDLAPEKFGGGWILAHIGVLILGKGCEAVGKPLHLLLLVSWATYLEVW